MTTQHERDIILGQSLLNGTLGFDPRAIGPSSDAADMLKNLNDLRSGKRDAKSDPALLKVKAVHAKSVLEQVRADVWNHAALDGLKELLGVETLDSLIKDIKTRVDTRDTSKPVKKLGPDDVAPRASTFIVDKLAEVESMIRIIISHGSLRPNTPNVFLNCVGNNLGRDGQLTLIIFYIPVARIVFMVDVLALGRSALTVLESESGQSIKSILEDKNFLKGTWDCRSSSDVLFAHYKVKLDGVVDIQLLEIATKKAKDRKGSVLQSLEGAFNSRLNVTEETKISINMTEVWGDVGAREGVAIAKRVFAGETGDPMEQGDNRVAEGKALPTVLERPIEDPMKQVWAQKVLLLPPLLDYFLKHPLYSAGWAERVAEDTEKRLELSGSPDWTNEDPRALPSDWKPAF